MDAKFLAELMANSQVQGVFTAEGCIFPGPGSPHTHRGRQPVDFFQPAIFLAVGGWLPSQPGGGGLCSREDVIWRRKHPSGTNIHK